ncbi:MAG: hypothetical protein U0793_06375 [Gemmataceae bacterium]
MTAVSCRISKDEWLQEIAAERNGAPLGSREQAGANGSVAAWRLAIDKVAAFATLEDDWDGLGAQAPTPELLQSALGLAHAFLQNGVSAPDAVVPGLDGSITFEWHHPGGSYTEIQVDRPLHAEVMVIESGKPPEHWTLPIES